MSEPNHPDTGTQPIPVVSPPPRRRLPLDSKIAIGILAVIAVALALTIGLGIAVSNNVATPGDQAASPSTGDLTATANAYATAYATANVALSNGLTQTAMTPTPVPTTPVASTSQGDVRFTQQSGVWSVTVNSVTTSKGDAAFTPKPGDTYLLIGVTLQNTSDTTQVANEMVLFTLRDTQGDQFTATALLNDQVIFGSVVAGQQLRGHLVYEVPKSVRSFVLQCQDNFDPSTVVQWNLSM